MKPETDITLKLKDNKKVEIANQGLIVGEVKVGEQYPHLEVKGFTDYGGPWTCGKFAGSDAAFYFPFLSINRRNPKEYQIQDRDLKVRLQLLTNRRKIKQAVIYWGGKVLKADQESETEVVIRLGETVVGNIWSLREEDKPTPYPQQGPLAKASIQICGFSELHSVQSVQSAMGKISYNLECSLGFELDELEGNTLFRLQGVTNSLDQFFSRASYLRQRCLHLPEAAVSTQKMEQLLSQLEEKVRAGYK